MATASASKSKMSKSKSPKRGNPAAAQSDEQGNFSSPTTRTHQAKRSLASQMQMIGRNPKLTYSPDETSQQAAATNE